LAGPGLYLLGNALFKQIVNDTRFPLSHLAGLGVLGLLALFAQAMPILSLSLMTTAVLVLVAAWESASLRSVRHALADGEPHT